MPLRNWLAGVALAAVAVTSVAVTAASNKTEIPSELTAKIINLPQDKKDFLISDKAASLSGTSERLYLRLKDRTPAEIEAYIDGLMSVASAEKFNPETDMAAIPLNTDSPQFNTWKVMRPREADIRRDAGPMHLSRYIRGRGGIATFANAPLALYPEDLIAGKVDVAIVGAPLDMGSGGRGAKDGPAAMRSMGGMGQNDMHTMVNPSQELNIVDYGDIAVDNMSTERTVQHVRERVAEIARTGTIPFIIGGDHSLEYPNVAALADVHGKGSFTVIHFDAHYDAGRGGIHFITHGAPVYRAIKEGHVRGQDYIQVGLRGGGPGVEGFEWMRDNGLTYYTMPTVEKYGWNATLERIVRDAKANGKKIYISFDVDILDPAYMPATGTPVPGGLTMREAQPLIRRLCAENDLVGFEIVELAPRLDTSYRSALNANYLTNACLTGVAMRKKGITSPNYLSELSTDHTGHRGSDARREKVDPNYGNWRRVRADTPQI